MSDFPAYDDRPRTEERGLYYRVEGDYRWHFDNLKAALLYQSIPDYWDDVCPNCGNKTGISGCRCPENHRHCPNCGSTWVWKLNRQKAIIYTEFI